MDANPLDVVPGARSSAMLAGLLLLAPALSGCLGVLDEGGDALDLSSDGPSGDEGRLRVFVQGVDAGSYGSASSSVADAVAVAAPADGSNVSLEAVDGHVELASQDPVRVAAGDVEPGTYGSLAFTLTDVHGTYDGDSYEIADLDLRVEADADVPLEAGSTTTVIVGVDLAATGSPGTGFDPGIRVLGARLDGEALDVGEAGPTGEPPVARAEIFNGTGVKIYESDFEAPGGETEAVAKHEEITFTARPSEDPDGTVTARSWSFSDGATDRGKTVTHAFATGGIHEATLTVADDQGNEDSVTFQIPVRYLVAEDGEDLYQGDASGSFTAGGDALVTGPAQEETRSSHTFEIPEIERSSSDSSDGSGDDGADRNASGLAGDGTRWSVPVHGGGHGAGGVDDPDNARRLAAATFQLDWSGEGDAYTLQVQRDGEVLAQDSGDAGNVTLDLQQIDGWYMDGGNYTVEVRYDQGIDGSYELEVTGTYIPIPTE